MYNFILNVKNEEKPYCRCSMNPKSFKQSNKVFFIQRGGLLCTRRWIQRRRIVHLMVELSHGGTASPVTRAEKLCCDHRAPNLTVGPGAEPKPNGPAFCPNTLPSVVLWLASASFPH